MNGQSALDPSIWQKYFWLEEYLKRIILPDLLRDEKWLPLLEDFKNFDVYIKEKHPSLTTLEILNIHRYLQQRQSSTIIVPPLEIVIQKHPEYKGLVENCEKLERFYPNFRFTQKPITWNDANLAESLVTLKILYYQTDSGYKKLVERKLRYYLFRREMKDMEIWLPRNLRENGKQESME